VGPDEYPALRDRVLPTLERLREQGKVRFLGITETFLADPAHRMLEQGPAPDPRKRASLLQTYRKE
jgi:hypothetical protein